MSTLERAIQIAVQAHANKKGKEGDPYILHPLRVMLRLPTEELRILDVLHDVVENSDVTFQDLLAEGFTSAIVEALESLRKRRGELYADFVRRAEAHPLARPVKLADILDNLDESRLGKLPAEEAARLRAKYTEALNSVSALPAAGSDP